MTNEANDLPAAERPAEQPQPNKTPPAVAERELPDCHGRWQRMIGDTVGWDIYTDGSRYWDWKASFPAVGAVSQLPRGHWTPAASGEMSGLQLNEIRQLLHCEVPKSQLTTLRERLAGLVVSWKAEGHKSIPIDLIDDILKETGNG